MRQPRLPVGMFQCRMDDKGRLKLPYAFQTYLADAGETTVFVTSLDHRTVRIYPLTAWRKNEELLQAYKAERNAAETVGFLANGLGAVTEMDAQGRVPIPPTLRNELKLTGERLHISGYRGHIEVMPEPVYEDLKRRAMEGEAEALKRMEQGGLE